MALIQLTYCKTGSAPFVTGTYDTVSHLISNAEATDIICTQDTNDGDVLYSHIDGGVLYEVKADFVDLFEVQATISCDINVFLPLDVTPDSGATDGTITVTALSGTNPTTYALYDQLNVTQIIAPQASNVLAGIAAGNYTVRVINPNCTRNIPVLVLSADPLAATFTKTDVTFNAGTDGTIDVIASGGSGNYTYTWGDIGLGSASRTGLAAATYTVDVDDTITLETVSLTIVIQEPNPPARLPVILLPALNPVRLVLEEAINGVSIIENDQNILDCDRVEFGYTMKRYANKFCNGDSITVQVDANFSHVLYELINMNTAAVVQTVVGEVVQQNTDQTDLFAGFVKDHGANQTRVYFNDANFPKPIEVNDFIELENNATFDGSYLVQAVESDTTLGKQYLVINKTFSGAATQNVDVRLYFDDLTYNVVEGLITFGGLDEEVYQLKITFTDDDFVEKIALSEPIDVRQTHPGTSLIEYRNLDNAFGIWWRSGITMRLRVESRMFKSVPAGNNSVHRNSDETLVITESQAFKVKLFETYQLPYWMHEKLSWIFRLDFFKVNGIRYQTEEGYAQPEYRDLFNLSNSSIPLEQIGFFTNPNSDDTSEIAGEQGAIELDDDNLLLH